MTRISKKLFVTNGAKGGLATKKKFGKDHFKMLAQKSVAKRRENRILKVMKDTLS